MLWVQKALQRGCFLTRKRCMMVHDDASCRVLVRQSVSMPSALAREVPNWPSPKRTNSNKVLLNLIERGIESMRGERERFFALEGRLVKTKDVECERPRKLAGFWRSGSGLVDSPE